MWENETLDLRGAHTRHWRQLRDAILDGQPMENLTRQFTKCVHTEIKWSFNQDPPFPWPVLLDAAMEGECAVRSAMAGMAKHAELAEHIAQIAATGPASREHVALQVVRRCTHRFLDQVVLDSSDARSPYTVQQLSQRKRELLRAMERSTAQLAKRLASDPSTAPRRPSLLALPRMASGGSVLPGMEDYVRAPLASSREQKQNLLKKSLIKR